MMAAQSSEAALISLLSVHRLLQEETGKENHSAPENINTIILFVLRRTYAANITFASSRTNSSINRRGLYYHVQCHAHHPTC